VVTGRNLRELRKRAGLGLADVARVARCSVGHLSRVETGQRDVTPALINAYEVATHQKIDAAVNGGDALILGSMRRRDLLALIASASVGSLEPSEPLSRLVDGLPVEAPRHVGQAEVAIVLEAVDFLTQLDLRYGGGRVAAFGSSTLRFAAGMLHGTFASDDVRDQTYAAVAALADRLAWSRYDSGDLVGANWLLTYALAVAAKSPDRDLWGHVLLNLSTETFDFGMPSEAVDIIRLALGDERVSSIEQANLHAVAARHCAGIGQPESVARHLGMAEEALGRARPATAPTWAKRVTASPGHFDSAFGLAYFASGDFDPARQRFLSALDVLGPDRVRTALRCRTRLAVIDITQGEPTGEAHAYQAVADASTVNSARVQDDLRMVQAAARPRGLTDLVAAVDRALARAV
jgi:transcriptional regulator with XRE-family HTH domain